MEFIRNYLCITVIYILIHYSRIIHAIEEYNIQILFDRPDSINTLYWKDYTLQSENYISKLNSSIHVHFKYNSAESIDKSNPTDYQNYVKNKLKHLNNSSFDILILEDKFLFGDKYFIHSTYIEELFNLNNLHLLYEDLTDLTNKKEKLDFDEHLLNNGYYDNKLYALPYELDFDVLYCDKSKLNSLNLEKLTWNELLAIPAKYKNLLSFPLSNDDELLNIFIEYLNGSNGNNIKSIDNNYDLFYNNTSISNEIFKSFKNFILKLSTLDIEQYLKVTQKDSYESFLNGDSLFFKGKASHYNTMIQNNKNITIVTSLPPKNTSILSTKYLVINKNSKVDKKLLKDVALQLTSKEFQIFKANQFGTIPTLDLKQKKDDTKIKSLLNDKSNSEIYKLLNKMESFFITEFFKSDTSAPLIEIRLLLPQYLKNYINNTIDETSLQMIFDNIKNLVMNQWNYMNGLKIAIYVPMIIFTLSSVIIMILIYENRNHPYLKFFSPNLCNLIIFGFILSIISPQFSLQENSIPKCQIYYVYQTITTDLIVFPMFAITYRIYSIYNSKSKFSYGYLLNNRHLLNYILIALSFMVTYSTVIVCIFDFRIISYGDIETYRKPTCDLEVFDFSIIERIINGLAFLGMFIMIIKTYKDSKRYGQFKFLYVLIFTFIIELIEDLLSPKIPPTGHFIFFIMIYILSMASDLLCIYLLVGSKLIYIFKHPSDEEFFNSDNLSTDYFNNTDIAHFIPMKKKNNDNNYFLNNNAIDKKGEIAINNRNPTKSNES
ncbi:periplasmic binding protein-like II [Anaeromyces robustus]|uniref:Periplasmic binding protein-like II n=1 Tax=Anaeromyces robustus TaxID=1754192 RepID=A0A1Y1WCY1_9FUNG|nr:periplasmic binding protein-like II [Anaeromyces robustus]|eukprot:ORX71004.1 periplasmic binding protein-like II [Anaeromyces robustus]